MAVKVAHVVFMGNGNVVVFATEARKGGGVKRVASTIHNRREDRGGIVRDIRGTTDSLTIPRPPRSLSKRDRWKWILGHVLEEMEPYCK